MKPVRGRQGRVAVLGQWPSGWLAGVLAAVLMLTLSVAHAASGAADPASKPLADPSSDAPEQAAPTDAHFIDAPSYARALESWRGAADINAWIGARFRYDMARALLLSESQRAASGRQVDIAEPRDFFARPEGVCVDLARFGVEALRQIEPASRPRYLMIEFEPVRIAGQTLRRHWVALYEHEGRRYFYADSKRPGHMAGPYDSTQDFIADYARYRGRAIVTWRELDSMRRQMRVKASAARVPAPEPGAEPGPSAAPMPAR